MPGETTSLGDALRQLMRERITPLQARFGPVVELWDQLLPAELSQHCKLTEVSTGELKVLVDSPSYAHELRMCSSALLEQLQQQCPGAKIRGIKIAIG